MPTIWAIASMGLPRNHWIIASKGDTSFLKRYGWNKKRHRETDGVIGGMGNQMARSTLLERRHLVQAYTWHGVPLTTALTRFTLGFHARLERLWEWETLMPKVTPLSQKSHLAIHCTSYLHDNLKIPPFAGALI